ncbi:MAG: hypothetical protein JKY48_01000 [Flavobacteriales bacterium]|nr:hypothetical protein [Flavobacteriales bacterium]
MIIQIRKSLYVRVVAMMLVPTMFAPSFVFAGGGPIDPNLVSTESSEMVNVSTGDFSYSIPLLDVGGYPITLSYNADVTMEQDASIVGLGWNISTGAINRTVRGLPDDFNGDKIKTTMNLRPNLSITNTYSLTGELVGKEIDSKGNEVQQFDGGGVSVNQTTGSASFTNGNTTQQNGSATLSFSTTFNNYTGNEVAFGLNASYNKTKKTYDTGLFESSNSFGLGAGLTSSSRSGLSSNIGANLALGWAKPGTFSAGMGLSHNTLHGSSLSTDFGWSKTWTNKETKRAFGTKAGLGGSFPFSGTSYTPTANFDFTNKAFSFDIDLGLEFWTVFPHIRYARSKYQSCLAETVKEEKAYGYLNLEKAYGDPGALQDSNLSLPSIHEEVEKINTPIPTYDYFTSSTTGDMFRAIRNDAGYVRDPQAISKGRAPSISGEVGVGSGVDIGVNLSYSWNNRTTGEWTADNPFSEENKFKYSTTNPNNDAYYEKFTFQKVNNRSTINSNQYNALYGNEALHQGIYKNNGKIKGDGFLATKKNDVTTYDVTNNSHYQHERRDRNVVFQHLSNADLNNINQDAFIIYPENNHNYDALNGYNSLITIDRNATNYPSRHIGEISVLRAGGAREVYGIPVMNTTNQISFNMSTYNNYNPTGTMNLSRTIDGMGLVEYDPVTNKDNSINNKRGNNFYYLKNEVPTHATSYLLTKLLSANYSDMGTDGPTPDDLGDYVKFNYSGLGKTQWRYPYQKNKATFNEGFKSNELDDMASYQYGERDAYLVHSIESKNLIAEFVYGTRKDGYDVAGENGGISSSNKTRKLELIKLFTRKGKELGEDPIKTVNFNYSYDLCNGTPDNINGGGKLTLTEVYSENYDSPKGKLHRYKFDYGINEDPSDPNYAIDNAINNPSYNLSHKDRWGSYKVDRVNGVDQTISHVHNSSLDNNEYPYAQQDKSTADEEVQAWKLKAIDLPSGSRMEVEYESDAYEFVQNHEATRMYRIKGYHGWEDGTGVFPTANDFDFDLYNSKDDDRFAILVEMDQAISAVSAGDAKQIFEKEIKPYTQLVDDENQSLLYFNTLLNLAPHLKGIEDDASYEYIQGYASIQDVQMVAQQGSTTLFDRVIIELKPDQINAGKNKPKQKVHPISRKAWQVINEALPLVLFPEDNLQKIYNKDNQINCGTFDDLVEGEQESEIFDSSQNHKKNSMSYPNIYHMTWKTGYASRSVGTKGWVRMRCGNSSKIGGGHRVKTVKVYDNWNEFVAGENGSVYGTQYDYTTVDARENIISSGVTSYEPLGSGADENAMRRPHFYIHDGKSVPSERFYTELPINEEIYATTDIRYAEVKVSSIDYIGLTLNKPGYTQFSHYTAKDFPLRFDYTDTDTELKKPGALGAIGLSKRRFGISHGMAVVANDMHGKFKGKYVYSTPVGGSLDGNLIYKEEHFYRKDAAGNLNSSVPVIHKDGTKDLQLLGVNVDLMTHLNKAENNNSTVKVGANVEINFPPIAIIPSVWPGGNTSEISVFSSLTTKIVYQSGILEKVVVEDNGRYKATTNLLYDAKTGAPITTEILPESPDVNGNGGQKLYDYSYPAHWAYSGMGIASETVGIKRLNILQSNGLISSGEKQYYHPGDVLLVGRWIPNGSSFTYDFVGKYSVVQNESSSTQDYFLVDENGVVLAPDPAYNQVFFTYLPGKKNFTGAPMASVTTLDTYPVNNSPYEVGYAHSQVLNVSGTDFYDKAKLEGECFDAGAHKVLPINPYRYNLLGQWKQQHSYVFDHDRDYSTGVARKDGLLTTYQPFWKNVGGEWLAINNPVRLPYNSSDPLQDWVLTGKSTLHNYSGNGLEAEDALGIKSASYVGYNRQHGKAAVSNSRYEESGFDGFEDYKSDGLNVVVHEKDPLFIPFSCLNDHFRLKNVEPTTVESHTGKYSIHVAPKRSVAFQSKIWDGVEDPIPVHTKPFYPSIGDKVETHRFVNTEANNTYIVMGWVKEESPVNQLINYNAGIQIWINGAAVPTIEKRSNIIDGWQRIELTFEIDAAFPEGTSAEIRLVAGRFNAYFDDIRVHPFDSEMEAQVIDAVEQRPMASLDNRNFATIYQYDEEGNMIRTIKETERGKQTVQESRTGIRIFE